MDTPLITLDRIFASLDGCPNLRRICDCMFRYTVPDIQISVYLELPVTRRYGDDFGDFAYRILRAQLEGKSMTYVELTVLNYGFWHLALVREAMLDEELALLNAAAKPVAMRLLDRSREVHKLADWAGPVVVAL